MSRAQSAALQRGCWYCIGTYGGLVHRVRDSRAGRALAAGAMAVAAATVVAMPRVLQAHDLERTQVMVVFSRAGSFVIDVANDPQWLRLRMEPFHGNFLDRVVVWVDGHEVRPTSVEFLGEPREASDMSLATYRLRGRIPTDSHTLRWYYGLVGDPYPLAVRRADGRVIVEEVAGDAWSRTIDVSGQFDRTSTWPVAVIAGLLVGAVVVKYRSQKTGVRSQNCWAAVGVYSDS